MENVYYLQNSAPNTITKGEFASGEAIIKTEQEIKNNEFVNLLNNNIGENTNWSEWKLGEDSYPEF